MSYKDDTQILLALSVASDKMMCTVHMFPEVIFMDVTSGTNRQKIPIPNGCEGWEW